jgi:CubicO group peptidase (beta-lactamase class C family)
MTRRDFLVDGSRGLLVTAAGLWPQRAPATALDELTADLDRRIPSWLRESRLPGLSIAIVRNASVAWRRAFGVRDAASRTPVTNDTMFEAASMSKPVFAYVVMKLVEDGVLDLDAPLTRYVPDRFLEGDSRLDLMTARHVLSHTGGFQNWRSDKTPLAIHFTPGSKYLYSGEGYNYLQTVVTKLVGQPFERYMRTRLFQPFGMTSSGYVWSDAEARRMARPHGNDGAPLEQGKSTPEGVARYGSAGALLSTPTDYAEFVINVIDPKPVNAFRLSRASVNEMLRAHVKLEGGEFPSSWALGWQIFHNPGRDFIYHGGNNRGFHCAAVASVEGKCGFVAMTNGDNGPAVLRNLLTLDLMQAFLNGT